VAPLEFDSHYREKYRHFIRKTAYFAWSEGVRATLRKIRSKRLERALEREIGIVVAAIEWEGERYIGITRALGGRLIFDRRLVFGVEGEVALEAVVFPEAARIALEAYLPVPSCPFPEWLPGALVEANPYFGDAGGACGARDTESAGSAGGEEAASERAPGAEVARRGDRGAASSGVYLLGFGGYVREQVLSHFRERVVLALDYRAELIREYDRVPFEVTSSFERVLEGVAREVAPLVVISTYHADHAPMALSVLDANPGARVFIEKPPVVGEGELRGVLERRRGGAWIDVGFNRRYAPLLERVRAEVAAMPRPLVLTAQVKELKLPPTHWYFWENQGTRITGNVCHWLDLSYHLVGAAPVEMTLANADDSVSISIVFEDGSLATIVATDRGDDLRGVTERIEVRGGGTTVMIDDFQRLVIEGGGSRRVFGGRRRDKGHAAMYADLERRWRTGGAPRYGEADLYWVPLLTLTATELFRSGERHRRLERAADRVGARVPERILAGGS
jgi:predicted dehydrogenase